MQYQSINRQQLERMMADERVDNGDSKEGVALVNVLGGDMFEMKHIPHSINIPVDEIDRFEKRFDKDKDIVVYCASKDCDASPRAAEALSERGFSNVYDYEGGVADWEQARQPLAGRMATPGEVPS